MSLRSVTYGMGMAWLFVSMLSGCSSLLRKDEFNCKAPPGVTCMSVEEAYRRSLAGDAAPPPVPGAGSARTSEEAAGQSASLPSYRNAPVRPAPESGTPIRSQARVLRVWIAPWEDKEGDLHDQSYLWVTVDTGRWLLDHTKRQVRPAYRPVIPPAEIARPDTAAPAAPAEREGRADAR